MDKPTRALHEVLSEAGYGVPARILERATAAAIHQYEKGKQVIRYAVIPTRGDRMPELNQVVAAIAPQVSGVIIVDNSDKLLIHVKQESVFVDMSITAAEPGGLPNSADRKTTVLHNPEQPPNLSRLWNLGLDYASTLADDCMQWEVAVLNDDAIVPAYWMDWLAQQMRSAGCCAAGFGPVSGATVHRTPGVTALHERLPGHAFMLAGEQNLRADEALRWWCGDNDLDMQARKAGGTLIVPGDEVVHLYPDRSTNANPTLVAQAGLDMMTFVEKWGFRPWAI